MHILLRQFPPSLTKHRCRFVLLCLLLPLLWFASPAAAQPVAVDKSASSIASGGKKIRVEWFVPKDKVNCPAIVLLHDSAGLSGLSGLVFRQCSHTLAKKGYAVLLVHYFDSTGHESLTPEQSKAASKHWPIWKLSIQKAVKHASRHPQINPQRIGLLGFSLGAYLSLAVATEKECKIAAVAEFFGGLPKLLWKDAHMLHLPPTLIVHGVKDDIVSVKEAHSLQDLLQKRNIPFEIKLYNCGHLFEGTSVNVTKLLVPGGLLQLDGDIADARDRTLRFFAKHLMPAAQTNDNSK